MSELPVLHREVMRPTTDRGRLAALATICSLAGVALGFALAGTMFASIPVSARVSHTAYVQQVSTPAWVGVGVRTPVPEDHMPAGAWIRTVRPGSPAAISRNIRVDDVIVEVNGEPIATSEALVQAVRSRVAGSKVDLTLVRGSERLTVPLRLQPMPLEIWRAEQAAEARARRR